MQLQEIDSFVRRKIIELIYEGKIKTVHVDDVLVNRQNIDEYRLKLLYRPLQLSRKYLEYFVSSNTVDHVYRSYIKDPKEHVVIINETKIIDFDLPPHAKKQFVRRLIYCITDEFLAFSVNISIKNIFKDDKEFWLDVVKNSNYHHPRVLETMIDLIKQSVVLQPKHITRGRDRREIEKRHNKYQGVNNRLVIHPFAFIIHDGVLKTVELYSSTADVRMGNAVTSNTRRWWEWFRANYQTTN